MPPRWVCWRESASERDVTWRRWLRDTCCFCFASEHTRERERVCLCVDYKYVNNFVALSSSSIFFLQTPSLLKRAGTDKLREVFQKYASVQKNGEHYMTSEDFVRKFLGLFVETAFNDVSMGISIAKPVSQTATCITGSLQGYSRSHSVISKQQQELLELLPHTALISCACW